MAREQKRLRRNSSQFIQQFSDSLQSGSTRRTGCCQNEIKKMRINQLSVSWQVTIRHENDVTHSYFQFNSLKFNSACFTGMNDDRLFAPKLHKSKLVGLNNKHLFQIYWEGVHVSVCVWLCVTTSAIHTPFTLCVCASVRVCVYVCHFPPLNTRWGCETCADHQTSLCTVLVLLSSWCHGGWSEEGVTVCVCVRLDSWGSCFPSPAQGWQRSRLRDIDLDRTATLWRDKPQHAKVTQTHHLSIQSRTGSGGEAWGGRAV